MKVEKIDLATTHAFTSFFLDYVNGNSSLQPFYSLPPHPASFSKQIQQKSGFPETQRIVLNKMLKEQYEGLPVFQPVTENIEALRQSNTFTITTGHQLNIFTGPLYFIYKIVTVINACRQLMEQHPRYRFVPVYWMASEDHDYEEIKSFRLYNQKRIWETEQSGAVGRFSTKGLTELAKSLPGDNTIFIEAYGKSKNLSDAVRRYVHALFGDQGLVVVDADHAELKKALVPLIREDVLCSAVQPQVAAQTHQLQQLGYHTQVNARPINFFYLKDTLRARLEKVGERFHVVDSSISFSAGEIEKLIVNTPEVFSPNVILRPLYQELILPNLAYIGGPAEIVYWLQLKSSFDSINCPFPILLPRNFALVIPQVIERKLEKTRLALADLFLNKDELINRSTRLWTDHQLLLADELTMAERQYDAIREKAVAIDQTLEALVKAELHKTRKSLEKIEKKMLKAEKKNLADKLRQAEEVKDALFPGGGLQERTDNFLNFYHSDKQFIGKLLKALDPFDLRLHVLHYDQN